MSITVAEFYTQVSAELRRGTSLDSQIPGKVRQAMRWIEGQYTFKYMESYVAGTLTLAASTIVFPSAFKKIEFIRITKPNSAGYRYLNQVDPRDVDSLSSALPSGYWEDGDKTVYLDATADMAYVYNYFVALYSAIPASTGSAFTVLDHIEAALLHATCTLFAPTLRDNNFLITHKSVRDEQMKSLIDADMERRQSNQDNSVIYGHEFIERINDTGDLP